MKIIFAQGNPGTQYETTRHNIGFFMLDEFAKNNRSEFTKKAKFHADIAEIAIAGEKILLVKPTTFYNETGQSARLLIDFYKLDPSRDFLVVHDDLALPFGTIRTREKGSDAGNNGIKSLNAHLGQNYKRIRLGIHSSVRERIPDVDFVLAHFSSQEKNALTDVYKLTQQFMNGFIHDRFELTKVSLPKED